ncbi:MAG: hypothetical protein LH619_05125 [Chitinophagaceae bacterium]|nr:hypothetical protein [Chitinophagaceae bacterium]
MEEGQILFITSFNKEVIRVTKDTAAMRNKMMIEIADDIVAGHISTGGLLAALLKDSSKKVSFLK